MMKKQISDLGKQLEKDRLQSIHGGLSRLEFCREVCSRNRYYPDHYFVRCGCS